MDFKAYLHRINFQEELVPSLKTLASLQKQHLINIPFENLDIHYDKPIVLEKEKIYNKVVSEGRGGFCYELNGLFYELLLWIGFKCDRVSARVFDGNEFGEEFDHLAIVVKLNGLNYLADVGFGDFTVYPLLLHSKGIQHDENGDFRIKQYGREYIVYKFLALKKSQFIGLRIFQDLLMSLTSCVTITSPIQNPISPSRNLSPRLQEQEELL